MRRSRASSKIGFGGKEDLGAHGRREGKGQNQLSRKKGGGRRRLREVHSEIRVHRQTDDKGKGIRGEEKDFADESEAGQPANSCGEGRGNLANRWGGEEQVHPRRTLEFPF